VGRTSTSFTAADPVVRVIAVALTIVGLIVQVEGDLAGSFAQPVGDEALQKQVEAAFELTNLLEAKLLVEAATDSVGVGASSRSAQTASMVLLRAAAVSRICQRSLLRQE
jgi:hypothetical protein